MQQIQILRLALFYCLLAACSKSPSGPAATPEPLRVNNWTVEGRISQTENTGVSLRPAIRLRFSAPLNRSSISVNVQLRSAGGDLVSFNPQFENADSVLIVQPGAALNPLSGYSLTLGSLLQSAGGGALNAALKINYFTSFDSTQKFPTITDEELLTKVQSKTFAYFWDGAHPVSGLARERNNSADLVTSGGSGFGMMAILVGIERNFISRQAALSRLSVMVNFLKNTAETFHGAYPHWLNGTSGAVIPFSTKDDGADLVETAYLIAGLLAVREYFSGADPEEILLRNNINSIAGKVEWDWFRKGTENQLYWHWSPNFDWQMNLPISGWNECLITYVLAAGAANNSISKQVYDNGWARNGNMKNNNSFYGLNLPLGPNLGGPLFYSHYSFLGINPVGLSDAYANYQVQVVNHSRINFEYCKANPKNQFGYSAQCWGLTASDIPGGYTASSPNNDVGVIAPTAALSSMPFTPEASMAALRFFYYTLGDRLWKEYGFVDAFSLKSAWFANSFLAIDQGPIIIMIENYRSGLIWNLLSGSAEIKTGLTRLGFSAPYL